jgi:5-methyltetrahydrofolate--homocysteine methyltransferase
MCIELGIDAEAPDVKGLFHQKYRGSRYSFGCPARPNPKDQVEFFELLKPEEKILYGLGD